MPTNLNAFRSFVKQQYPNISKSQLSQLDEFIVKKQEEEKELETQKYYSQATQKGLLTPEQSISARVPLNLIQKEEPKISAEVEKRELKFSDVKQNIDLLEKNLKEIEVSGPVAGRLSLLNMFTGGAVFPEAADYEALRKSLIAPLARAISGEVGVLTDRDIARAEGLLPKITDAKKVRDNKLKNLRTILSERTQTTIQPSSRFKIEAIE